MTIVICKPDNALNATVSDLNGNPLLSRIFYSSSETAIPGLIAEAEAIFGLEREQIVVDIDSDHFRFGLPRREDEVVGEGE